MANTFILKNSPSIRAFSNIVGKKEGEGPLAEMFDRIQTDTSFGEASWEKAESRFQYECILQTLNKGNLTPTDIDLIFAGDLLNQCVGSHFGVRELNIPLYGLYGACSTMGEGLGLASLLVNSNTIQNGLVVTSSHFCAAERQFRFPLEYGSVRPPTSQWTVTASGSVVVGVSDKPPFVKGVTVGKIVDYGITDINNMGAGMAPAACYTIQKYLVDTNTSPSDYDLIITGDLGTIGSDLLLQLLSKEGINLGDRHNDCGKLIFDIEKQDVHSGGSGCGCSASVLTAYILPQLQSGALKDVLFVPTGALMSTVTIQQGESIPSIAHLVHLSSHK